MGPMGVVEPELLLRAAKEQILIPKSLLTFVVIISYDRDTALNPI